jgi:hypothetical protein
MRISPLADDTVCSPSEGDGNRSGVGAPLVAASRTAFASLVPDCIQTPASHCVAL